MREIFYNKLWYHSLKKNYVIIKKINIWKKNKNNEIKRIFNTINPETLFGAAIAYHHPNYVTIILSLPNEVITGNTGILEPPKDGKWGFPPEYIVGAFYNQEQKGIKK